MFGNSKVITVGALLIGIVGFTMARNAGAWAESCAAMKKGDVGKCTAEAKKTCTDDDAWGRKQCQYKLVEKYDLCASDAYGQAASSVRPALETFDRSEYRSEYSKEWIASVTTVDAQVASFMRVYNDWKACGDRPFTADEAQRVQAAPSNFRKSFQGQVDGALKIAADSKGNESYGRKVLQEFIDLNAKIPGAYRYKEKELATAMATFDKWEKDGEQSRLDAIASRGCPSGKPLDKAFATLVKRELEQDGAKRTIIRQTMARHQDKDGSTSRDNVPVVVCEEVESGGKKTCSSQNMTVFREKPYNGSWGSWQVSVGGGDTINCQKMK